MTDYTAYAEDEWSRMIAKWGSEDAGEDDAAGRVPDAADRSVFDAAMRTTAAARRARRAVVIGASVAVAAAVGSAAVAKTRRGR
jgi:hypothetical protein